MTKRYKHDLEKQLNNFHQVMYLEILYVNVGSIDVVKSKIKITKRSITFCHSVRKKIIFLCNVFKNTRDFLSQFLNYGIFLQFVRILRGSLIFGISKNFP